MKNEYISSIFLFSLFLLKTSFLYSQTGQKEYYKWFDNSVVSYENTGLFNGVVFENRYLTINEKHRFFETSDFMVGSINYDDQRYYDLLIKYDLFKDQILVELQRGYGKVTLQLIKNKIKNFTIDNHKFINVEKRNNNELNVAGFHELLLENSLFKLLKKHKKNIRRRERKIVVYYEFIGKYDYILMYNNEFYKLNTKNDFIKIFPQHKKHIDSYYKASRGIRKSSKDLFNESLLKRIFVLELKEKNF